MTRLFSTLLFSSFLLFQTALIAEEENASVEVAPEESEAEQSSENDDDTAQEKVKEALSELEKEALAAEAAELRESGIYDEPVEE